MRRKVNNSEIHKIERCYQVPAEKVQEWSDTIETLKREKEQLKQENKALRLQSDTYFDEWQNEKLTSQGLRDQCKEYVQDASKYRTLVDQVRFKLEMNPSVDRYIELVNYIDRLEKGDN